MVKDTAYYEKLELVYRAYEESLDLEVAMASGIPLTELEQEAMLADTELAARINVCDAKIRSELVSGLVSLMRNATNEGVKLAAIEKLGKIKHKRMFKQDPIDLNVSKVYKVIGRDGEVEVVEH